MAGISLTLSNRISRHCIRLGVSVSDRDDLLSFLAQEAEQAGLVSDWRSFLDRLQAREAEMSTGVGRGIAVPHAEVPEAPDTFVIVCTLDRAIEYYSLDDEPVDVVFLIGGKPGEAGLHVQILSRIARLARQPSLLASLKKNADARKFMESIEQAESMLYESGC